MKNLWTPKAMFSEIWPLFKGLGFSHSRMVEDIIDLNNMFPPPTVYEFEGLGTCTDDDTGIKLSVHQILLKKLSPSSPVSLWYKPEFDCGPWKGDHKAPSMYAGEQSTGVPIFKQAPTSLPLLLPGIRQSIVHIDKNRARFQALKNALPVPEDGPSDLPASTVRELFYIYSLSQSRLS